MSNTRKPGIHLHKDNDIERKPFYYWHARARNGRITCNGETYSTKAAALNSIASSAVTLGGTGKFEYYDHSKKDSPLKSYMQWNTQH